MSLKERKYHVGQRVQVIKSNGGEASGFQLGCFATIKKVVGLYSAFEYMLDMPGFTGNGRQEIYYVGPQHIRPARSIEDGNPFSKKAYKDRKDYEGIPT